MDNSLVPISTIKLNPLPCMIYDLQTLEVVEVNLAASDFYGYSKDELLGMNLKELDASNGAPEFKFEKEDAGDIATEFLEGKVIHKTKGGERIPLKVQGHQVILNARPCMLMVCEPISSEKHGQKAGGMEHQLNIISRVNDIGYWKLHVATKQLIWPTGLFGILPSGASTHGWAYSDFLAHLHDQYQAAVQHVHQKALKTGDVYSIVYRITGAQQGVRWVEEKGRPIKGSTGEVEAIEGSIQDVTVQKREKQRLELLESVIVNTNDAVLITEAEPVDEPGPKIIYVNEAFTKMTGYEAEEVIGKTPRILQGPNSNFEELAKLGKAIRNWESYEITTINYKKTGEEFWINFKVSPVADATGWFTHWIAIERDVTQDKIKAAERELIAQLSLNFNAANDLLTAAQHACQLIGNFGKFDWVELWLVKQELKKIKLIGHYFKNEQDQKLFESYHFPKEYEKNQSLAGKIWASGAEVMFEDVTRHPEFEKKALAKQIGLQTAKGFPLIFNSEVVGVLKVGVKSASSYFNNYTNTFRKLQTFLGSELNRRRLVNDLGQLFNAIPDILGVFDVKGHILKFNESGANILGLRVEQVLGSNLSQFVHPTEINVFTDELNKCGTNKNFSFECRVLNQKGDAIWLSWYCNYEPEDGLVYATAKDITDAKNLKELNRQVGRLAKIGSWEVDLVKQSVFWSEEVHLMHETNPATYVPYLEEAINYYREDFREMVRTTVANCVQTGESWDYEAVIVTAKKNELWVRSIGNAEFVDGKCVRIYGGFQDINARKQYENRLILLSQNLPGIVYEYHIRPDGTDVLKNISGKVEEIWGFTADEMLGDVNLAWEQIKAGGKIQEVQNSIRKSIETKSQWQCQIKYVMPKTGKLRTHVGFGTPSFLADGTIIFNSIILDITQQAENEDLLEQTTKVARIGSWEMDLSGENVERMYSSPVIKDILELEGDQELSMSKFVDFHIGESKERIQRAFSSLINDGVEFEEELLLRTAKGNERWSRAIGKIQIVNNRRTKIYGSHQDIHEKKIADLALEHSLKELQDYKFSLDQSAIIAFTDAKGIITSVNENFCKISGYREQELVGKTHQLINSRHHPQSFFQDLWKTISSGKVFRGEIKNKAKDGSYYWVDTTIVPFLDENNRPKQYLAIRFDITDRKKIEEENLFKAGLLNNVNQAAIATNLDGVVNYWNSAAEKIYGWKAQEAIGKNILDLTPNTASLEQAKAIMNALVMGETWKGEFDVKRKDGSQFPALVANSPIYNDKNELTGIIGISSDITEEKMNEELLRRYTMELERSNEELEQFAYVASHDLQEPLRMISSFMDLLQRKYGDKLDEKGLQYVNFAMDGAKRMKNIILDLLAYSRAGKSEEFRELVDVNSIVEEFKQLRRRLIAEKKAVVQHAELPMILSYKVPITQIFNSILDNALNYTMDDVVPLIEINYVESEQHHEFSIRDNGIGIDPIFHDKIFMVFQRLHNRGKYPGTGIGLSVAKRQIEFLNGKIWLESEVNKGSIFYIQLPK